MATLLVAGLSFFGFILAYRTYGRWLGRKIFGLDGSHVTPSHKLMDGVDYVPTRKSVVFGHHFTSIAGTGPIVGPAIAVFWGWLPALLWVVFGSIFIGAVHDFGALAVSLRNQGKSIGQICGTVIGPRARLLMMCVLLVELTIVLAVFGLVIAAVFNMYNGSVLAVWISLPLAVMIGFWSRRKTKSSLAIPAMIALAIIYGAIALGQDTPVDIQRLLGLGGSTSPYASGVVLWTIILFIYCFAASVLPVWTLLQPRDYVNSLMLFLAVGLVLVGLFVSGVTGKAELSTAPAVAPMSDVPHDAPPLMPFLFITIACGAVSGFHSLVSSGTSSKQIDHEQDARAVGYGSMLAEAALAVVVILACTAGVGMGLMEKSDGVWQHAQTVDGAMVTGADAWHHKYLLSVDPATGRNATSWASFKLGSKVGAFVEGGANFLNAIGIPLHFAVLMLGVMVACFAATTLDTATRLQRYVIQEIGETAKIAPFRNKYVATSIAVAGGLAMALFAGKTPGAGGMVLWPLFGATNQVLAGLGFLVVGFFLVRRGKPVWFLVVPAVLMIGLPAWAMTHQMIGWYQKSQWLLFGFGMAMQILTGWLVVEAALAWSRARAAGEAASADVAPAAAE